MSDSFEELLVWARSKAIAVRVCRAMEGVRNRSYVDQVVRSSISISSNIAEGAERNSRPEFIQFLGYARGSAGELRTQIMIGAELGYLPATEAESMVTELREISRMLFGLIRSLRKPPESDK